MFSLAHVYYYMFSVCICIYYIIMPCATDQCICVCVRLCDHCMRARWRVASDCFKRAHRRHSEAPRTRAHTLCHTRGHAHSVVTSRLPASTQKGYQRPTIPPTTAPTIIQCSPHCVCACSAYDACYHAIDP